jgi:hypothetical protein
VLLERDARELLRRVAGAGDPDPLLGLRPEALRGGQRDVLRRAVGLGEDALPDALGRALELLDVDCFRQDRQGSLTSWRQTPVPRPPRAFSATT